MKVKRIRLIYFSATNTTQTIVRCIGAAISKLLDVSVQENDFTLPKARKQEIFCQSDELAIVGVPVYAGRVPNKLLPYVRDAIHGSETLAVPVVLYGNRDYDDALIELRDVLESNGFRTMAGAAFVGEHSFSKILAAGRPDAEDLQLADTFANQIVKKLEHMRSRPEQPIFVKGNTPYKPYFAPKNAREYLKVKPVVSEACIGCGLCAKLCTLGSIDANDVRQYVGPCIKCGACIKKCPKQARFFDNEIYLYHKHELEKNFQRRAHVDLFL